MLINTNEPTCPTCGGTLESKSFYNIEADESGNIVANVIGFCDNCGNRYEWEEHYAYKGFANVEKTK